MLIGYARTSTVEQEAGLAAQERDLQSAGCERIFSERVSSAAKRDQLTAALSFACKGDAVVVTKPDRLARNTRKLLDIEADLTGRGAGLIVLSMGGLVLDTRSPTSKLMLTILGGIGTWEREIMLERQKEGFAKAKADDNGKPLVKRRYAGRSPTAMNQAAEVTRLKAEGLGATAIAGRLGMSRMSVYRVLNAAA